MLSHKRYHLRAHVITVDRVYVDTREKTLRWRHACFLVATRAQPAVDKFSRRRLAKIMGQGGQHHRDLPRVRKTVDQLPRAIYNELRMNKNISFGMPLRIL